MNIVVSTPTGHVGSVVAQKLVEAGKNPLLLARHAEKVKTLTHQGAQVMQGDTSDPAFVKRATIGAQAFLVITPVDPATRDNLGHYRRFGEAAAAAIQANRIPFVVHLSSSGAELQSGNGPIAALYQNEKLLRQASKNIVQLRAAYFMENTLGQIGSILQADSLFTLFPGSFRFPMIAARDIGERVAQLLVAQNWSGEKIVELQGPGEISYDDVAGALSQVLKRGIKHVTVAAVQFKEALLGAGFSPLIADEYAEMSEAVIKGRIRFQEKRGAGNTTKTTYLEFAREIFKPAFEAVAAGAQKSH